MSGLQVSGAVVRFGDLRAVDGVDLTLAPGHVVALLGPSGSGKSTLLRAIAGLQPLSGGTVSWDGQDLARVKVHRRGFGVVFQDGQLFPNMDVGRNIAYGLARLDAGARRRRVSEMLELVDLAGYERRKVTELSGGQAQRVALARSLAPSPRLLLLDEPLSALEHGLRRYLAQEVSRILRDVGTTAVYVTHDQEEASMVGDTVAVMLAGRIVQADTPDALWRRPTSEAVARFLGNTAFIDAAEAGVLGWAGELPPGHVLGVGQGSLVLADDGVAVPVVDEGFVLGHVQIGVRLPGGQRAVVTSEQRAGAPEIRVRLTGGAIVPK